MEEEEENCCCDLTPLLGMATMAVAAPLPPRSSNMSSSLRSQSDSLNGELFDCSGCVAVRLMFTLLSSYHLTLALTALTAPQTDRPPCSPLLARPAAQPASTEHHKHFSLCVFSQLSAQSAQGNITERQTFLDIFKELFFL